MDDALDDETRERVVTHVLRTIHDGLEGEVVDVVAVPDGTLVGVKVDARGYFGTADYALVTLDADGEIVESEACTGREMRERLSEAAG